jgi:16S rRNA (uracil1498-N3)-methyltransferase
MRTVVVKTLHAGSLSLELDAAHYVRTVLRLPVGTKLKLVARDMHAFATIKALEPGVELEVEAPMQSETARRQITWIQGLPKGDKADAIVQDATELGATRIVFASMERCVRVLDGDKREKMLTRWRRIAEDAVKQCGRLDIPAIKGPLPLDEILASHAPAGSAFVLYEKSVVPLRESLESAIEASTALTFAVGPEGGITEEEIARFERANFLTRSLGTTILRTETAAAAVLGAIRIWQG